MKKIFGLIFILGVYFSGKTVFAQTTFEKTFETHDFDQGNSVKQTPDNGYIIGGSELWKIDEYGTLVWKKQYPAVFANLTFDGGFILINNSSSEIVFTKVDINGDSVWQTTNSDGVWANEGYFIEQTTDSGFIVTGRYQSVTGSGMMLLKLNKTGNKVWRKTFSEPTSAGFNTGYSVQQTADNGFILTGLSKINYYDSTRHEDVIIVKTDSLGNEEWRRFFGGSEDDAGYCVKQDVDLNYIISGRYGELGGGSDMYLIKLDTNGDSLFTKTFGGVGMETATGLWPTTDGGYILTGSSNTFTNGDFDGYVVKTDNNGDTTWTNHFGNEGPDTFNSIQQTNDNGYIAVGNINIIQGRLNFDLYAVKMDTLGNSNGPNSVLNKPNTVENVMVYPNPNCGMFNMRLPKGRNDIVVFNLLGEAVYSEKVNSEVVKIDISQHPKGVYFYNVTNKKMGVLKSGKLIIN